MGLINISHEYNCPVFLVGPYTYYPLQAELVDIWERMYVTHGNKRWLDFDKRRKGLAVTSQSNNRSG